MVGNVITVELHSLLLENISKIKKKYIYFSNVIIEEISHPDFYASKMQD